jgi:acyl carrier protein
MLTTDIQREIRNFLVDTFLFGRNEELRDDAPLMDKVIDSHGVVELVVFLQERFAISVEDDEVTNDNLDSVNKTVAYVARKLAARSGPRIPSA